MSGNPTPVSGARRAELFAFCACVLITLAPLLSVTYLPSGDGPEHVLQAVVSRAVADRDPHLSSVFELAALPPTSMFAPVALRPLTAIVSPQASLRLFVALLVLAMAFAVRRLVPPGERRWALLPLPVVLIDLSLTKGFLSFYGSAILAMLAFGALRQSRIAFAVLATITVWAHPMGYVLLGLAVAGLLLTRAVRLRDAVLASIPSFALAVYILSVILEGQGSTPNTAGYMFTVGEKLERFFVEGWHTVASFQAWTAAAAIVAWLALCAVNKHVPKRTIAVFALYLAVPEEFGGWSWISVRIPLFVAIAAALDAAEAPVRRPQLFAAIAGALVLVQAVLTTMAYAPSTSASATTSIRRSTSRWAPPSRRSPLRSPETPESTSCCTLPPTWRCSARRRTPRSSPATPVTTGSRCAPNTGPRSMTSPRRCPGGTASILTNAPRGSSSTVAWRWPTTSTR